MNANTTDLACQWVATDPDACRTDVRRLGMERAIGYNISLANDSGDPVWHGITEEAMRVALVAVSR